MERGNATEYFRELHDLAQNVQVHDDLGRSLSLDQGVENLVEQLQFLHREHHKVILVGNGGSSSVANHLHNDLSNAAGIRALVFQDIPLMTAISNDHGYGSVFERPSRLWLDSGDMLIAISSSGCSENILRSARVASKQFCKITTFSGFDTDNPLRSLGSLNFYVPSHSYGYVELIHGVLTHMVTDFLQSSVKESVRSSSAALSLVSGLRK